MEIMSASLRDLNALNKLERACFEKDAWPFLDLLAVLTFPEVVRLKAVEEGRMIGFVAGDPRPSEGFSWSNVVARLRGQAEDPAHSAVCARLQRWSNPSV